MMLNNRSIIVNRTPIKNKNNEMIGVVSSFVGIVEDDYRIGNIHGEFVNKVEGFRVIGKVLNGGEAKVDVLLLDIYMPDLLGTELMHKIREANINTDVIIISAATKQEIIEEVIRFGAFDYIIKPVKMERFIQTLHRYKKMKANLKKHQVIDQSFLDQYFGHEIVEYEKTEELTPKGIDPITLKKIEKYIFKSTTGSTAEEMGKEIGVSRTTARRYLEYLTSTEKVIAELEYGAVGRPERKYFASENK